jgi:hypothetical protein
VTCDCYSYTHCGRFYGPPRVRLFDELVFENFYRLMLHWCPEVRKLFHFILIFKLNRSFLLPGEARRARPSLDGPNATAATATAAAPAAAAASSPSSSSSAAASSSSGGGDSGAGAGAGAGAGSSASSAGGAPIVETLSEAEFDAAMGTRSSRHAPEDGDNKKAEDEFGPCSLCKTTLNHDELKTDA